MKLNTALAHFKLFQWLTQAGLVANDFHHFLFNLPEQCPMPDFDCTFTEDMESTHRSNALIKKNSQPTNEGHATLLCANHMAYVTNTLNEMSTLPRLRYFIQVKIITGVTKNSIMS